MVISAFLLLLLILAVQSRCQASDESGLVTLKEFRAVQPDSGLTDPLGISTADSSFELFAVSADGLRFGYASDKSTEHAARELIQMLAKQGWQVFVQADSTSSQQIMELLQLTDDDRLDAGSGRAEPLALILEHRPPNGNSTRQMLVQIFPVRGGSSIVIEVY